MTFFSQIGRTACDGDTNAWFCFDGGVFVLCVDRKIMHRVRCFLPDCEGRQVPFRLEHKHRTEFMTIFFCKCLAIHTLAIVTCVREMHVTY